MTPCSQQWRAVFTAVLAALSLSFAVQTAAAAPNIIFIIADDLGYGDLGAYGQLARAAQGLPAIQTPRLDQLAEEGMRFTQFYAAPSCAPARSTLNTGFHLGHAAIRCNSCTTSEPALRTEDITIAEMLKRANYRTCYLGKWHKGGSLDNDVPAYTYGAPQNKGFDESYVYMGAGSDDYYPPWLWRNGVKEVIPENAGGANVVWSHDLFTQEALAFITRNAGNPFYLHVAYTIPHRYLECPDNNPYADQPWPEIEKRFASMITKMDRDVGRIADLVDQLGIAQNTLICFTSDNGPQNREGHSPEFFDSNSSLRGIKFDFWEGGIRVPFIARWPGRVPAGATSDWTGALYDVMPTAAEIAGVKAPGGIDGISFYSALTGAAQPAHAFLFWEGETGGQRTVRMGNWKSPSPGGVSQLYNLLTDPAEQTDVASLNPGILAQMNDIKTNEHRAGPPPVVSPVLTLVGQVSGSGSQYIMDFGTLTRGSAPVTLTFRVKNGATEYANLMEGQVISTGLTDSRLSTPGGEYAYLVDGGLSDEFSVTFTPSVAGSLAGQTLQITGVKRTYGDPAAHSPVTLNLAGTVAGGPPSDFDQDGDVDQSDFAMLQRCLSGILLTPPGCAFSDLNHDGLTETADVSLFLDCMAGPDLNSPCGPS